MINKRELTKVLSLSCVENYFLAWLKQYYDISKLYGVEFVSMLQIFNDFSFGATYENYHSLSRLQDVAEEYGITTHQFVKCGIEEALELIGTQTDETLVLIRVKPCFFANFKRSSWRKDHYLCIDKNLKWVNQYPLSEGVFLRNEFEKVFDGTICLYRLQNAKTELPNNIVGIIKNARYQTFIFPKNLLSLEEAIGILKIARKRLEVLYERDELIARLLHEQNDYLDKLYLQIHLKIMKGQTFEMNKEELLNKIDNLMKLENKVLEGLQNE